MDRIQFINVKDPKYTDEYDMFLALKKTTDS